MDRIQFQPDIDANSDRLDYKMEYDLYLTPRASAVGTGPGAISGTISGPSAAGTGAISGSNGISTGPISGPISTDTIYNGTSAGTIYNGANGTSAGTGPGSNMPLASASGPSHGPSHGSGFSESRTAEVGSEVTPEALSGPHTTDSRMNIPSQHHQQLSIHSVNSIIEPVTPPSVSSASSTVPLEIDKDYLASLNKIPLSQLKSDILRLSKDQYGCRFLQKRMDENLIANYSVRYNNFEIIFEEIYLNLYELIIDPFGNYLIQKLIKYCSNENLNLMLEILQSNLFQISINQHGTRALQKIIDSLNSDYQLELLTNGLKPFIIELIKDLNGNHVIQKILNKFQPLQCQFIYDSILNGLFTVATHKHGCCVLQKCLNHVTTHQLNQFINEILNDYNFNKLINDQFGNYVLQYLISINNYQIHYKFYLNLVKFNLVNYCNLKFSSNVIEKYIKNCYNNEYAHNEININFINLKFELVYHILKNPNSLNKLINDPFGNYVIQTLIDHLSHPSLDYSSLKPKNLYLLLNPLPGNNEMIKYEIVNIYFQNCKIVSSFGKRIQLKISLVLSNNNPHTNFPNQGFNFASSTLSTSPNVNVNDNANVHLNDVNTINPNVPMMNSLNFGSNYSMPSHSHSYSHSSTNSNVNHSNSNSISSLNSRSNSYPSVHSRSNSLQLPQFNPNYVFDGVSNVSNNMNNLHLNTPSYYPTPTANAYPTMPGPSAPMNNTSGPGPLNGGTGASGANGMNGSGPGLNQNYLKTPQVFSNAPYNDYVHDNLNYFR